MKRKLTYCKPSNNYLETNVSKVNLTALCRNLRPQEWVTVACTVPEHRSNFVPQKEHCFSGAERTNEIGSDPRAHTNRAIGPRPTSAPTSKSATKPTETPSTANQTASLPDLAAARLLDLPPSAKLPHCRHCRSASTSCPSASTSCPHVPAQSQSEPPLSRSSTL